MADIRDIARKAGVSPATVSRVLNGHPHVREETRAAVLAVIEAENYRPNQSAAALRRQRSDLIGYLHFGTPALQDGRMAEAAETVLFHAGFKTFSCNADGDPARVAFYLDAMIGQRVAGVILSVQGWPERAMAAAQRLQAAGIAAVLLNPSRMMDGVSLTALDPVQSWACGWQHLLDTGHRRVLCLLARHQTPAAVPEALEARTCALEAETLEAVSAALGGQALAQWDALYCGSEPIAVAALRDVQARGVQVPGDLSILAMGGTDFARMTVPRLSVVGLPMEDLARSCADLLLARIDTPEASLRKVLIEAQLIPGQSTAPR